MWKTIWKFVQRRDVQDILEAMMAIVVDQTQPRPRRKKSKKT